MSWTTYERLLEEVENRRVRLTYDRGDLEIMTPSHAHEVYKRRMGRLVNAITEEFMIPIKSGGSTTCRSVLLAKGLEPDECYWVDNERAARDLKTRHPAPDLSIEVEVSRSVLDRLGIYASLRVLEVWRVTQDSQLLCLILGPDGEYHESLKSGRFPFLAPAELMRFLVAEGIDETSWIRGFREWVRAELLPRLQPPAK